MCSAPYKVLHKHIPSTSHVKSKIQMRFPCTTGETHLIVEDVS